MKFFQSRNKIGTVTIYTRSVSETTESIRDNRLKSKLDDGVFVNQFNPLFNLMEDYPIPTNFSIVLNFINDIQNEKLIFNYIFENIDTLNEEIHRLFGEILNKISLDQDLLGILIDQILPYNRIVLIPSFRTFEISEKKYQEKDIRELKTSIETILTKSFNRIPIGVEQSAAFEIPNLALMLYVINENKMTGENLEGMNKAFFTSFNDELRTLFPDINLFIDYKDLELSTTGGYKEYGRNLGDWTKLGHGTQELISLLFLLKLPKDRVYIIDEPDNGLYPGLQLKFLQFIKEFILTEKTCSKQFFFATHSTCFIDFKGNCSHFVCEKAKKDFTIGPLKEDNLNIIRDVLGLSPGALLQANGIIWVEGSSEIFYIKMLFKCFDFDLDEKGVLIIPYNGKDHIIKEYLSLDLLIKTNPNFIIEMDSDKDEAGVLIDQRQKDDLQKKLDIQQKYLNAGKEFWLIDEYHDVEGFIPQDVLNEYFRIDTSSQDYYPKKPYQKLWDYLMDINDRGYDKVRASQEISDLILKTDKFRQMIKDNSYLKEKISKLKIIITNWNWSESLESTLKIIKEIEADQEIFGHIENLILTNYQKVYYSKCSSLQELNEEEKNYYLQLHSKIKLTNSDYVSMMKWEKKSLKKSFGLQFNKANNIFFNEDNNIDVTKHGTIKHKKIRSIEQSGEFIEDIIIEKIDLLLDSLINYWKKVHPIQVGSLEVERKVNFKDELRSKLQPLKLINGVWCRVP